MNTNQGMHRIHLLAERIMLFGALAGIALWILNNFVLRAISDAAKATSQWGLGELVILIAAPIGCGGILWVIAWIVDGFMSSSGHN